MTRVKAIHDLPKASKPSGWTPDPDPRFAPLLSEALREASVPKPVVGGAPFRFSDAGKCARALSLKAIGAPREPMDLAGHHVTNLGTLVHEAWQAALVERYGDRVQLEAAGTIDADDELLAGGSCDALLTEDDGSTTLLELKTTGGFSYKLAVGERGDAQGPRETALWQTALNARAHGADRAVIVVLSTEAISKGAAERKGFTEVGRFGAEWTIEREQLDSLADREVARLEAIRDLLAQHRLAPRHIPDHMPSGARVVDVDHAKGGRWELRDDEDVIDSGTVFWCNYCDMRDACRELPAEACDAPELGVATEREDFGGAA